MVTPLTAIASGSNAGGNAATYSAYEMTIPNAAARFTLTATAEMMLRNPALLIGYDVLPDDSASSTFEVIDASYNRTTDVLTLTTILADGSMLLAVNPSNPTWALQPKFFRIITSGQKGRLPDSSSIIFEFQGAAESSTGSNTPGTPIAWTSDLADLEGLRFLRMRVTFDIDSGGIGVTVNSERPAMQLFKIPLVW